MLENVFLVEHVFLHKVSKNFFQVLVHNKKQFAYDYWVVFSELLIVPKKVEAILTLFKDSSRVRNETTIKTFTLLRDKISIQKSNLNYLIILL